MNHENAGSTHHHKMACEKQERDKFIPQGVLPSLWSKDHFRYIKLQHDG